MSTLLTMMVALPSFIPSKETVLSRDISVEEFSQKALAEEIVRLELDNPRVVFAQMRLESANFKSYKFREHNNLTGMKLPRKRETTAIGADRKGYSIYEHWKDAVKDYSIWQSVYAKDLDRRAYLNYLDRVYAQDELYVSKVLRIADSRKVKELFNN